MFRKSMAIAVLAALLACGGGAAAFAQDTANGNGTTSSSSGDDSNYTPRTPTRPSLVGSAAIGECIKDAAWIHYNVVMTDPDGIAKSHEAKLVLSDGTHTFTIDLGPLVNNRLSGSVLWPGATVDGSGHGVTWPGWELVNGAQTQTGGNFGWTRGKITATLEVNPELAVPLSYPPATSACAVPAEAVPASSGILAVTGLGVAVGPIAIGAGIVLLVGLGLLLTRRLRRS
ncbi:cell wall protein [Microbacterium sp.]|uniref:cell wall protein n=1 Tax=Microbacterium sp. TaxID=51671 RepID=UPI003A8E1E01